MMQQDTLLEIKNLSVRFPVPGGEVHAVNNVDLSFPAGKTVGIVGESGCGKSVLSSSILRLNPDYANITGEILFRGNEEPIEILSLPKRSPTLRSLRGGEVGMIFQESMRALFPLKTVGAQLGEAIRIHVTEDKKEIHRRSVELLEAVRIPNPEQRLKEYPHQFSGGMAQRVMIAIALAANPKLLIADEPTTALDVTIQAQVLSLIRAKQEELGMTVLFITHDMGVIMEMADIVAVMYLGRIVELANAETLFTNPLHPYTRLLLQAIPSIHDQKQDRLAIIEGNVPIPLNLKERCGFAERCPVKNYAECERQVPQLQEIEPNHWVACFAYNKTAQSLEEGGDSI